MAQPLRVLVVDDSAFMRAAIERVLSAEAQFEVVGAARDGAEAVKLAADLRPDAMTMDFNMPGLNGAEATRAILKNQAVPIVMLSAHTKEGAAETVEALAAGAVDFVQKPDGEVSPNLAAIKDDLIAKLTSAAGANLRVVSPSVSASDSTPARAAAPRSAPKSMPPGLRVVVIASSTGGPAALTRLIPELDAPDAAVLVVQHMPEGFTGALAEQLDERTELVVREARGGESIEGGHVFVAAGGRHLTVDRGGRLVLTDAPPVHGVRPAADVTFKSIAQGFGARTVGVVLTGMGRDGAVGLAAVKAAGGRTIAQDKDTSTVYGMPRAAIEMGVVDEVAPLARIAPAIARLVR